MFTSYLLLLNWIDVQQSQHDECDDGWEDGEQQPYHAVHSILIGNRDDSLTGGIGTGNEACKAQQQGNEGAGDGCAELHGHRTRREDKTR